MQRKNSYKLMCTGVSGNFGCRGVVSLRYYVKNKKLAQRQTPL